MALEVTLAAWASLHVTALTYRRRLDCTPVHDIFVALIRFDQRSGRRYLGDQCRSLRGGTFAAGSASRSETLAPPIANCIYC